MLQALGEHSESERLNTGHRLIAIGAVAQHPGKSGHFGHPAAVVFAFQLELLVRRSRLSSGLSARLGSM